MKYNLILILIVVFSKSITGQAFQWAQSIGSAAEDGGVNITVANDGYIYHTGYFSLTADFDPGLAVNNLSSAGLQDIYIQKIDSAGNVIWTKQIGGTGYDAPNCITTDVNGNIYIGGSFKGTVDFDPNVAVFNLTSNGGSNDIFILKLDSAGNFIWAKKIGGPSNGDGVSSIALDQNKNIYTTGSFGGIVDFDPGILSYNLTSAGSGDIFISKLDSNGNFIFAKRIGGSGSDRANAIHLDIAGNVFTTGFFTGTVDFNPNGGVYNLSGSAYLEIFICKSDTAGNFMWARQLGSSTNDIGNSITTDNAGNVLTTGYFSGTADFDPGAGAYLMTASGNYHNIYVSKLDGVAGNFIWAKQIKGSGDGEGSKILADNSGAVYFSGYFRDTVDFDPGPAFYKLNSYPYYTYNYFVSKLDTNGNFEWVEKFGSYGTMVMEGSNIYTGGTLSYTSDMDPGAGVFNLTEAGLGDIFVHKYSYCGANHDTFFNGCDSVTVFGTTYFSNNDFVVYYSDINGCDSNLNVHIRVYTTSSDQTHTVCDSLSLNGQTYTATGIYTQTWPNVLGCDSIVTLHLTVNYAGFTNILQKSCTAYTLNGQTYAASGIYTQMYNTVAGCDSTVTLNLTVGACPPCDADITINATPFYQYQTESQTWIATSGTVLIPLGTYAKLDADANSYVALNPGFKAEYGSLFVAQAFNGCTAGVPQLPNAKISTGDPSAAADEIVLYPNPTSGLIHIQHDEKLSSIQIFDMVGKLVVNQKCNGETETNIDLSNLPNGVYHVKAAGYNSIKVVKNN
jgi:hypothetical protein